MAKRVVILFVCVFLKINEIIAEEWDEPYFIPVNSEEINGFSYGITGNMKYVKFQFNEEVPVGFILGELTFIGERMPTILSKQFDLVNDNGKVKLKSIYKFDYEKEGDAGALEYIPIITLEGIIVQFQIEIVNINDNPLEITVGECTIPEGPLTEDKKCSNYKIVDKDGISDHLNLDDLEGEHKNIFGFECQNPCHGEKEATIILRPKVELDYEKVIRYNFDWKVKDEEHEDLARVQVNVEDIADEKPVWTKIQTSQKFKEKSIQTFEVVAVDGDKGINDEIIYQCLNKDKPLDTLMKCSPVDKSLILEVEKIDRDPENLSILKFEVSACEKTIPTECIDESIVFLIDDINDNKPEIKLSSDEPLVIPENKYETIDLSIEIKDLDLADAGTFNVELNCDIEEVESALQVIPGMGYREGKFSLSIINAAVLDYDREEKFRDFEITVKATEKEDSNHIGEQKINIKLLNWNDEEPIFIKDHYEVTISELFGRYGKERLEIDDLKAVDADYDDYVTHALIGSITNILILENEREPELYSKEVGSNVQLFDFEKQPTVTFQVEASDNFQGNQNPNDQKKKYAEVKVNLEDANDETPVITLSENTKEIYENVNNGHLLGVEVTASDLDKSADLKVKIDWDKSYATKYGLRKPIFDEKYKESFKLNEKSNDRNTITYEISVNEVVENNTPDYEEFDTIYLYITVTDDGTEWGDTSSEVILIVTVDDLNDNKPVFVPEVMNVERKIKENPDLDATIGMVAAEDKDVSNVLKFSLKPKDNYFDGKIKVNDNTRMLYVADKNIDAEDLWAKLKKEHLEYQICVTDGDPDHEVCEDLHIYVVDENDETPYLEDPPTDQHIKEHSVEGSPVLTITAKDDDRDSPNNKVTYSLEPPQIRNFFTISEDKGEITVKGIIDREEIEEFEVTVVFKDNPENDKTQKGDQATFKIILDDINDQIPEILTTEIKTKENLEAGEVVYIVEAFDKDKPGSDNAKIEFKILDLIDCYQELDDTFFKIETDSDFLTGKGTITALKPLRNMYTTCKMEIQTTDHGEGPQTDKKQIPFIIDKFNFEKPYFKYPTKPSIYLRPNQAIGTPVKLHDGSDMPAIQAAHRQGSRDEDKYNIRYRLADESEGRDTFGFKDTTITSAHLTIIKEDYDASRTYNVIILAQDDGEPSLSSTYEVKIGFYDTDKEPVFKENEREIDFVFDETVKDVQLALPRASLEVDDEEIEASLDIFYHILEDQNKAFQLSMDSDIPVITVVQPLFVLNMTSNVTKVVATKNQQLIPPNVDKASVITINLKVNDINDNAPVFNEKKYSSGAMVGYEIGRSIVKVQATDLDEDGNILKYSILEDTFEAIGTAISAENKFLCDEITGDIKLNFEVLQNMKGYFTFDVEVNDSLWQDTTNVNIYIISDENEVAIRFDNTLNEILENRENIQRILSSVLGYNCAPHSVIEAADESGNPIEGVTEVKVHCVDDETKLPVKESVIKTQMNSYEVITQLRDQFRDYFLRISDVKEVIIPPNMEEQLKIWLICVSVVLGSVCVVLIVAFILKTRSLLSRINKLTTVDFADKENVVMDSNAHVPAAPNTNRRAVEGSNPIFNTNFEEKSDIDNYDRKSISSGDSDFSGIENNPAFNS